jgi:vitamin K-dependent gamma-carboxylase
MIMVGLYYRIAITGYTVLWVITYLMEKSCYNNHYYLLILICLFMIMCPAQRFLSVDAMINPRIKTEQCPGWWSWIFILQMLIVYSYAGVAKMDADWLAGAPLKVWFLKADQLFIWGEYMKMSWYQKSMAIGGLLFDSLFVPLMLWKKTRNFTMVLSTAFHIHNSFVFSIEIFPYMMIAMNVFFYDPQLIGKVFMRRKFFDSQNCSTQTLQQKAIMALGFLYFLLQILLPLRHLRYPGNVHWTEEGHRMAWQMMVKSKLGLLKLQVALPNTGKSEDVKISDYLTQTQIRRMSTRPDMIWQFAQYLNRHYQSQGYEQVEVYAKSCLSLPTPLPKIH